MAKKAEGMWNEKCEMRNELARKAEREVLSAEREAKTQNSAKPVTQNSAEPLIQNSGLRTQDSALSEDAVVTSPAMPT